MSGRLAAREAAAAPMIVAHALRRISFAALAALGGCATEPTGPTVAVLPGSGKTLDQFRADDSECQPYALAQARAARPSSYDVQRLYDLGYIQCMYAKGHRVPVLGPMAVHPAASPSVPAR